MAQSSSVVRIGSPARGASVSVQEVCLFLHSVSNIAYGPVATGGACPNLTLLWSVGNRQSFGLRLCPFDSLLRAFGSRLRPFGAVGLVALGSHLSLQLAPWSLRLGDSNLQPCSFYFFFQQHEPVTGWRVRGRRGGGEEGGPPLA